MDYNMVTVWRNKLAELELQRELMSKDKQFSNVELNDMDEMIKQVKHELANAIIEERKNESNNRSK